MSFIPRATFQYPLLTPSWFAGHMAKSLREMGTLLQDIDLVIEARDARLPLTSINRAFDAVLEKSWGRRMDLDALGGDGESSTSASGRRGSGPNMGYNVGGKGKERLVVYTKKDLAEERYEKPLIRAFRDHSGQKVLFSDTTSDSDVKEILRHAVKFAKSQQDYMTEMRILVVGMPNVGKSSLLNALRRVGVHKAKHFKTGAMAGVTKKLTGTVKIHQEPTIYVYDTPGVMVPFLGHGADGAEKGLKYALTAGIKEDLFELEVVVDYLLWRMNQRIGQVSNDYLQTLPLRGALTEPTDDLYTLLDPLCDRIGALKKGGERDYEAGLMFIIRAFREGKLGRWTFDNLEPKGVLDANASLNSRVSLAVKEYLHGMPGEEGDEAVQSKSQLKKAELKARQEKRLAKWKLKYPALAAAKAARRR